MSKYRFPHAKRDRRTISFTVRRRITGKRLDAYLAMRFAGYSRSFMQEIIQRGWVTIGGKVPRKSHRVTAGEEIVIELPPSPARKPQPIPLEVVYQDRWLIAVNKSPGIVVHPAKGHPDGTMINALVYLFRKEMDRDPGFHLGTVHRLDKDTSGLIIFLLDEDAHHDVQRQFEERTVGKSYITVVAGEPGFERTVAEESLGYDDADRKKVAVDGVDAVSASTEFEVLARGRGHAVLRARPRTGRSHQIRVHLAHLGHPVLGDASYGSSSPLIGRQALHSESLRFFHPGLGKEFSLQAPLPADILQVCETLGLIEALRDTTK